MRRDKRDCECVGPRAEDPCGHGDTSEGCPVHDPWYDDDGLTDVEADAQTLAMAGWGTDEDYGYFGDDLEHDYIHESAQEAYDDNWRED